MAGIGSVSVGGGSIVITTPVFGQPIPLPISLPAGTGLEITTSDDQLIVSGALDSVPFSLAIDTAGPGEDIILGSDTTTVYQGLIVDTAAGAAQLSLNVMGQPETGVLTFDTTGGVTQVYTGLVGQAGLGLAVAPTANGIGLDVIGGGEAPQTVYVGGILESSGGSEVIVGLGPESITATSDGRIILSGPLDSTIGGGGLALPSAPSLFGESADTVSSGSGADSVVKPGTATVAGLGGGLLSAVSNIVSGLANATLVGASNIEQLASQPVQMGSTHEVLSTIQSSSMLGFSADSTVGASNLASSFISDAQHALASIVPAETQSVQTATVGHSLSMDNGLTTVDVGHLSHAESTLIKG